VQQKKLGSYVYHRQQTRVEIVFAAAITGKSLRDMLRLAP
jgi:hypothetical protein